MAKTSIMASLILPYRLMNELPMMNPIRMKISTAANGSYISACYFLRMRYPQNAVSNEIKIFPILV